jgi:uncharacterized protein (TIGR01777 family)
MNNIKSILITGGSGLLGTALTDLLLQKGYHVSHLGRSPSMGKVKCYRWSVSGKYIDPKALHEVDAIIHLAGAGVADKRWTSERKTEILESRTKSAELIYDTLQSTPNQVKVVVSATAVGYYGINTLDEWCDETRGHGEDFLATVCQLWEAAANPIETLGKRLVKIRVGVVLSNKGGALVQMAQPVKWCVGAPLGTGKQWVSWIHIHDLCGIFLNAIENENMAGVYNAVAPNPVTNRDLNKAIASALHRPLFMPPVPEWAMKILLGEMSEIVVTGQRVKCDKIKSTGFEFKFTDPGQAVKHLLSKR